MLHIFLSNRPDKVRYGTTGWPVPGYDIELRGEDGGAVADGEPGDLYIHGPSAAMMYWGNRAKTRETFQGGWTKSGDKYLRNADGSYTYAGRTDDMLKVERHLRLARSRSRPRWSQHPAVLEAAVIGVADAEGLTKTKAFVVLKPGGQRHRRRAQGLRQGPARALQVPARDRVRRPNCPRPPPARSSASSCASGRPAGREETQAEGRDAVYRRFVLVASMFSMTWRFVYRRPVRDRRHAGGGTYIH